jgi:hypothetical protein
VMRAAASDLRSWMLSTGSHRRKRRRSARLQKSSGGKAASRRNNERCITAVAHKTHHTTPVDVTH